MANPQKENGYAPIANEILDAMSKFKFNGTQFRILMVVWRYTYGFSRKEHEISVSFLVEATGITKRQIQKELKNLMDNKVLLEIEKASFNSSRIIAFNKNYEEWEIKKDTSTGEQKDTSTGEQKDTSTGEQKDTSTGEQKDTQENNIKTILKQEEEEEEETPGNPIQYFENNFGVMTPIQMQNLWQWVDDFNNAEVVCMAVQETALVNPRIPFSYLERILSDWYKRKLFTASDVLREKRKHEAEVLQFENRKRKPKQSVDWEKLERMIANDE